MAAYLAGAVAAEPMRSSPEREADVRRALAAISRAAGKGGDLQPRFDAIAAEIERFVSFDRISVTLMGAEGDAPWTAYVRGVQIPGFDGGESLPS